MSKLILVSGAGSGIGSAIAQKMAQLGYSIALLGRNKDNLEACRASLAGSGHITVPADITDAPAIGNALATAGADALYGVVANAGVGGENHYGSNDRWQEIININLTGSYNLVNECLPLLRSKRVDGDYRHILIISSILSRLGVPGYSAYCASKAGLLGLMRSWAAEFTAERILCNAVCPGWVNTAMARQGLQGFADGSGKSFEEVLAEQMAMVPLGKMSEPEEIATMAAFLLKGEQTSITGQTLDINNGALMPC